MRCSSPPAGRSGGFVSVVAGRSLRLADGGRRRPRSPRAGRDARPEPRDRTQVPVPGRGAGCARRWRLGPALVVGDTNSGRRGLDEQVPVFSLREEGWIDALAGCGWRDAFRCLRAEARAYTWYSPNGRNGFRIDQASVNAALLERLHDAAYVWGGAARRRRRESDERPRGVAGGPERQVRLLPGRTPSPSLSSIAGGLMPARQGELMRRKKEGSSVRDLEQRLAEARDQHEATAEILRLISSSPTDVQPVFAAVAASAARLCDAFDAAIFRVDGDALRLVAHHGPIPAHALGQGPLLARGTPAGRAVLDSADDPYRRYAC